MGILIRLARTSDADAIRQLTSQLGYEVDTSELEARLARMLSQPDQQIFVAELDGRAVGWVHATIAEYLEAAAFGVIGGLVVDREHRRNGIGRLLMEKAEVWSRQRGCTVVRLSSSATRTSAHQFYDSVGYTRIKTQYAFAKALDPAARADLRRLVPRTDE